MADCDGDGSDNGTEDTNGADPYCDETDPAGDCDGDGEPNGTDTHPNNPCLPTQDAGFAGYDSNNATWSMADCDGDGLDNGTEDANGTDPFNTDTDGDGLSDHEEATGMNDTSTTQDPGGSSSNATDPCDPMRPAGYTDYDPTNTLWQAADCDGDGVLNGIEENEGTDPYDAGDFADNDGDTIPDALDLDDDNDGILDTDEQYCLNLINNPSFEDGNDGWTSSNVVFTNDELQFVLDNSDAAQPDGFFAQTVSGLADNNGDIIVEFDLLRDQNSGSGNARVDVFMGGTMFLRVNNPGTNNGTLSITTFAGASVTPSAPAGFPDNVSTTFELTIPYSAINSDSAELLVNLINCSGCPGDRVNLTFDNIGVRPTCDASIADFDGDNIPNHLDTDSDGDNCPDAIEADGGLELSDLDTDNAIDISVNGVDANGVPVDANSGQSPTVGYDNDSINQDCQDIPVLSALEATTISSCAVENISLTSTLQVTDTLNSGMTVTLRIASGYVSAEDELTYSGVLSSNWNNATGTLTIGPGTVPEITSAIHSAEFSSDPGTAGTRVVDITVNDGTDNSNTLSRTIEVLADTDNDDVCNSDETPTGGNETDSTTEDTELNDIDVLANNTDDDAVLTVSNISTDNGGTAVVDANGNIDYTPAENFCGTEIVSYDVCDPENFCVTDELTITVTCVQDAPIGGDETATTMEDVAVTTVNLLANNIDPDGDPISIGSTSSDVGGTVTLNGDGTITFLPPLNFNGTAVITYEVCDNAIPQNCVEDKVVITVTPVNDGPSQGNELVNSTPANPADNVDITANNIDPESDPLVVNFPSGLTGTDGGIFVDNGDGTVDYTPPSPLYSGMDTLFYEVCDTGVPQICVNDTLVVNVTPNETPIGGNENDSGIEDTIFTGNIDELLDNNSDPEGDDLDVNLPTNSENGGSVSDNGDGTFSYDPAANFCGEDWIIYEVCDPYSCVNDTIFIDVACVQDAPTQGDETATTMEDTSVTTVDVLANNSDPDGDPLTIGNAMSDVGGSVNVNNNGSITYDPPANFFGTATITYEVCDNAIPQNCVTDQVVITVTPVNDGPSQGNEYVSSTPSNPASGIDIIANNIDPENDPLLINFPSGMMGTDGGTFVDNGDGTVDYTPPSPLFNGMDTLFYEVCDTGVPQICVNDTLVITVAPNESPLGGNENESATEDTAFTGNVDDLLDNNSDPEGDDLHVNLPVSSENGGSIADNGDGTFTYNPPMNFCGADTIIYDVCDPFSCVSDSIFVEVACVQDAPNQGNENETVAEDNTVTIDATANNIDPDGDNVEIQSGVSSAGGSVTINGDGTVDYTPPADFFGMDTILYEVCDDFVPPNCVTDTIFVDVTPVNDAPVAMDDEVTVGDILTMDPTENDTDVEDDELTVSIVTDPLNGTAVVNSDGTITYDGMAGYCGLDSLEYSICDDGVPSMCDNAWIVFFVIGADTDLDGIPDHVESNVDDMDQDGLADFEDPDSDGDSIPDALESQIDMTDPCNPIVADTDNDGIPDYLDTDADGDGIPDEIEAGPDGNNPVDTDSDGEPDWLDEDSDNDGISDEIEAGDDPTDPSDSDSDGTPDYQEEDSDNDGIPDNVEAGEDSNDPLDTDNDGTPDYQDTDSDNDNIPDEIEAGEDSNNPVDTDNDGTPDYQDTDSDNDSIPDDVEAGEDSNNPVDTDNDGTPDYQDPDSDNDNIPDDIEAGTDPTNPADTDEDGEPDFQDPDSDGDGLLDIDEIEGGIFTDCDGDDIPNWLDADSCEVSVVAGVSPNGDGIGDTWTIEGIDGVRNVVKVFNRWGAIVYEAIDYQNDWAGTFYKNGSQLPTGTYYYTIEFPDGEFKPMTGWIYLNQ